MSGRWKRIAALGAVSALCLVVTAGIASARPTAGTSPAALNSTLNIYGMGGRDDVAQGRINIATKVIEDAGGKVENPVGGYNTQAFLAQLASGNVPDLVYFGRGEVGSLAAKGALMPLANCIRSENIDMKQYRAAALREVQYKGQTYALPEFTNQITIIVSDDVAKAAGVSINDISTTNWKKLRQVNKRLLKIEDGKLTRIGFDPKIPEFFPLWVKWFGKDLISKDGLKAQLNSREAVAALAYTLSLIRDHGGWDRFKAFRDTFDFFGRQNPLVRDQMGAWPMESFIYNVFADNSPNEELTAKYFTNRKGGPITLFAGNGWAIPRGAKDPDLACKWMKAMTAVDTWVAVAKNRLNVRRAANPPRAFTGLYTANTRADIKIFQDIYQPLGRRWYDDAVQKLYTVPRYGFALPPSPGSAELRQAYIDAINRALAGTQSPKAALDQAQREAQAAIDRNK
jgi:multiple sugar transport system substrate-binding protein